MLKRDESGDEDQDVLIPADVAADIESPGHWNSKIHPWQYPDQRSKSRLSRNDFSIPGSGKPCVDIPCLSHKRRVGKMIVGLEVETEDGRPSFLCMVPACWPMFLFTECLILGISLLAYASFLPFLSWGWWLMSLVMLCYVCGSLFKTATSDPGIVPRVVVQPHENATTTAWRWNERAQSYHESGVVFCNESGVLVEGMDHFCPWTGTTIAGGNIKYFYMFLSGVFLQMMYVTLLMFVSVNARNATRGGSSSGSGSGF
jgi:hypothetical protein